MELGAAGAAEVAELGVIDAELVVDVVDELGDEEVEVRVALAVPVRRHVERHALEPRLEVGAMVEVEAANEVLIRLAVAGVLGDDHPGHGLEQLAFAGDRAEPEVGRADPPLGRAGRDTAQVVDATHDLDRVERGAPRAIRVLRTRRRADRDQASDCSSSSPTSPTEDRVHLRGGSDR